MEKEGNSRSWNSLSKKLYFETFSIHSFDFWVFDMAEELYFKLSFDFIHFKSLLLFFCSKKKKENRSKIIFKLYDWIIMD